MLLHYVSKSIFGPQFYTKSNPNFKPNINLSVNPNPNPNVKTKRANEWFFFAQSFSSWALPFAETMKAKLLQTNVSK